MELQVLRGVRAHLCLRVPVSPADLPAHPAFHRLSRNVLALETEGNGRT